MTMVHCTECRYSQLLRNGEYECRYWPAVYDTYHDSDPPVLVKRMAVGKWPKVRGDDWCRVGEQALSKETGGDGGGAVTAPDEPLLCPFCGGMMVAHEGRDTKVWTCECGAWGALRE